MLRPPAYGVDALDAASQRPAALNPPEQPRESFARATRGPSQPIPYREDMERRLGESFADVRAYAGGPATESALQTLGAAAAASGESVAFQSANPSRELVAHELVHVVQMRRASATAHSVASTAIAEDEARAAEGTSGTVESLSVVPSGLVLLSADTAAAAGKIQGKIANAATDEDQSRLEMISMALKAHAPAPSDGSSTTSDLMVQIDGENLRIGYSDLQPLIATVDGALQKPSAPAKAPPPAPTPKAAKASASAAPAPAQHLPGVASIQDAIADAEISKDEAHLNEIFMALQAACGAPSDTGVVAVPIRGKTHNVERGAIVDLLAKAEAAQDRLQNPPPAAPAAPLFTPSPPRAPQQSNARQGSGQTAPGKIQDAIVDAVQRRNKDKLERIRNALTSAARIAEDEDAKNNSTAGGKLRVRFEGQSYDLDREDAEALVHEAEKGFERIAGAGSIDELTGSIKIHEVGVSATLPSDRNLYSVAVISLKTSDNAVVKLTVTRTSLEISTTGLVVRAFRVLQPAHIDSATVDFRTGKVSAVTNSIILKDVLEGTIQGFLAGTPLATPGYNPMEDRDVLGSLRKVADNIKNASVEKPADGGKPAEAPASSPPAPVHPSEVTNITPQVTLSFNEGLNLVDAGTGLVIAPGGPVALAFDVEGTAAQFAGAGGAPATSTTRLKRARITSDALTIVAGNEPLFKITGAIIARGGGVTITSVQLLGKAEFAATVETVASVAGFFLELRAANPNGVRGDLLEEALRNHESKAKLVPGLSRALLEKKLAVAITKLLSGTPKLLGFDTAELTGVASK